MKILHAWDTGVDELPAHLCNDGSMMFTLTGEEEQFLFCADVHKEMEQYIILLHLDESNTDYVQAKHHGN